jgi:hypothetical protein
MAACVGDPFKAELIEFPRGSKECSQPVQAETLQSSLIEARGHSSAWAPRNVLGSKKAIESPRGPNALEVRWLKPIA